MRRERIGKSKGCLWRGDLLGPITQVECGFLWASDNLLFRQGEEKGWGEVVTWIVNEAL